MSVRAIQYLLASVFLVLGGWCLISPASVMALTITPAFQTDAPIVPILVGAFGAQALAVIKEAGLNPDIVNVNGGAIALGHPLGCTGAKLSVQILNEMRRSNQKYGMVTACVGGGQGIAGIYERLN